MAANRRSRYAGRHPDPGEGWQLVSEGYKFTEGPATNSKGEVFFNDVTNSKTYRIGLDGKLVSLSLIQRRAAARRSAPTAALCGRNR